MCYNPFTLKDKLILITGASSGIGRATAIECALLGAKLIITARNKERLNDTFLTLDGEDHIQIIADLQNEDDVRGIINQTPKLDGIVHCAGILTTLLFQYITREDLDNIMNVNFISPIMMTQSLISQNKINRNASIVFISSIMGTQVSSLANSMYSSSKAAIEGMVKGMALDLASKKIRVNCVRPGMVQSNFITNGAFTKEQLQKDAKENYPLKRYGRPEEIAYSVVFLLSDSSNWITGTSLLIDGGFSLK